MVLQHDTWVHTAPILQNSQPGFGLALCCWPHKLGVPQKRARLGLILSSEPGRRCLVPTDCTLPCQDFSIFRNSVEHEGHSKGRMTAWEVFFLFQQLGADCCLSLMLTVFIGLAWSLCFTQPSGSGSWDQLCFFKEDGLMLQTFFLSVCKSSVFSEISLTDLCLEGLFVDICERLYLRFRFGCLFQLFYFHLQSCRQKLNFSREGFSFTVLCIPVLKMMMPN